MMERKSTWMMEERNKNGGHPRVRPGDDIICVLFCILFCVLLNKNAGKDLDTREIRLLTHKCLPRIRFDYISCLLRLV